MHSLLINAVIMHFLDRQTFGHFWSMLSSLTHGQKRARAGFIGMIANDKRDENKRFTLYERIIQCSNHAFTQLKIGQLQKNAPATINQHDNIKRQIRERLQIIGIFKTIIIQLFALDQKLSM